jgi:hypothetical protein
MAKANCSESSPVVMATMVMPFVMTAAPVPSVMMAAAPVPTAVMAMPAVLDLDSGSVLPGQGRDADSGGSGQGHCQRGNQCRADQNDTSHAGSSDRWIAMSDKFPSRFLFHGGPPELPNYPDVKPPPDSAVGAGRTRRKSWVEIFGKTWQHDCPTITRRAG